MTRLDPAVHVFAARKKHVDSQDRGERSDAVLRTAMTGHAGDILILTA